MYAYTYNTTFAHTCTYNVMIIVMDAGKFLFIFHFIISLRFHFTIYTVSMIVSNNSLTQSLIAANDAVSSLPFVMLYILCVVFSMCCTLHSAGSA